VNGAHDLGGMDGFGPVRVETDEPVFHAAWERDVFAAAMYSMRFGGWSLDEFRLTIERQHPLDYLSRSYYERWLAAIEQLVVQHGLATPAELAAGRAAGPAPARSEPGWTPSFEPPPTPPRYQPDDVVRVANRHPPGHTRQPRYARGRLGRVVRLVGAEPLPEHAAEGISRPEHVYLVRFEAAELWGEGAGPDAVYLELWESYLEPAG
jgi:nitrile hydratase subunit beta